MEMIMLIQAPESMLRLYFASAPPEILARVKDAPSSSKFLEQPTPKDVENVRIAAAYLSAASKFPYSDADADTRQLMHHYSEVLIGLVNGESVASIDKLDRCNKFLSDIEEKNYL